MKLLNKPRFLSFGHWSDGVEWTSQENINHERVKPLAGAKAKFRLKDKSL